MDDSKQEIADLEQAWMEAIQQQDLAALERIVAQDYSYTATGHGRHDRAWWLGNVLDYHIESFTIPSIDIRVYGETAVALLEMRQTATAFGQTRSGSFLITDAWVKRDGRWQVVARSSIAMPPAG